MDSTLASLAKEIRQSQAELYAKVREFRAKRQGSGQGQQIILRCRCEGDCRGEHLHRPSKPPASSLSLSVAAVDGGVFAHRLHGHDIVATRTVGVRFVYENSELRSFEYFPSRLPETKPELCSALDEHEANMFRSLVRIREELSCAMLIMEKNPPELLLMDGSLWTVPSDRPAANSTLAPLYSQVIECYRSLYETCDSKKTQLCGVIKDSRSRRLASEYGFGCSDTVLCSHMLDEGERTVVMRYNEKCGGMEVGQNGSTPTTAIAETATGASERLMVFYLKPSEQDLPLRIEFLKSLGSGWGDEKVASTILALSSISKNFAYPAILVEADMRAAMDANEIENIQTQLGLLDLRPLRRNARPFR